MDLVYFFKLARLQLNEAEKVKFSKDLKEIITFVGQLQKVDTTSTGEKKEIMSNVLREDEKKNVLALSSELLEGAPDRKDGWLRVKAIFKNE